MENRIFSKGKDELGMLLSFILSSIFSAFDDTANSTSGDSSRTFIDDLDPLDSSFNLLNWSFISDDDYDDNS